MKGKKIIIFSIIINILLIGVIYNFIKKDYINTEKIIVKTMTGTEYENNITSLNQSHSDYANYIQASKAQIASAITDMGVTTSNDASPETMANNIKSIARDASELIIKKFYIASSVHQVENSIEQAYLQLENSNWTHLTFDKIFGYVSGYEVYETNANGEKKQIAYVDILDLQETVQPVVWDLTPGTTVTFKLHNTWPRYYGTEGYVENLRFY